MSNGREDDVWFAGRQATYLAAATAVWHPGSPLNVLDHLAWAARSDHRVAVDDLTPAVVEGWMRRIDTWGDCADFDVLRLLLLWSSDRDALPVHVVAAIRERLLGFRYWYTDPGPPEGTTDARWYWSENHRLIFHTIEHLAGLALPESTFTTAGLSGAEHAARGAAAIHAWCDEKAVDGFSEWHSDAYLGKDLAPLLALVEHSADEAVVARATAFADLVLLDLALHSHRDTMGSTHGRSYMRLKRSGPTQPVFSALKLCFDRTDQPWPLDDGDPDELLPLTEAATFLARCHRYRPPAIARRIACSPAEVLDREGMGTVLDPGEAPGDDAWTPPVRSDGLSYTDPAMVPFWWDRGALTPWPLVPLTLDALDRHRLWDGHLFAHIRSVRDALGDDRPTLQALAHGLHPLVNAGLLTRVETTTWRNGHAMLSSAQGYRPGAAGYQHHVWQATLDEHAVVFTTHPGHGPTGRAGDYRDGDRYWTGSATLPHAVQDGRVVAVHYRPGFEPPELDVLRGFAYADFTHAFFPTERFDEVVEEGPWVLARRRDAYVALWCSVPTEWRSPSPEVWSGGLTERFDLVAPGVDTWWVCRVGDVDESGSFAAFVDHVTGSPVDLTLAAVAPHPRMDNRFVHVPDRGTTFALADDEGTFTIDLLAR